jgi:hypothetical protein
MTSAWQMQENIYLSISHSGIIYPNDIPSLVKKTLEMLKITKSCLSHHLFQKLIELLKLRKMK